MIYRDTSSCDNVTFSLHDCIATGMTWEKNTLTFFFSEGIILGKKFVPKGRCDCFCHSGPAKLSFVGADLRFFHVYESWKTEGEYRLSSNVTAYDLPEIIAKVASGEWRMEFIEEYRSDHAVLYRCGLWRGEAYGKERPKDLTFALDYDERICEWDENEIPEIGVDLFADNLHFLGNTEEEQQHDFCLHGKVTMRVNGYLLVDEVDCCVTASALRFLRSLSSDHKAGEEEFLFPCCGNMLIPSNDGKTVTIIGCPNGEDLEISTHRQGNQTMIKNENVCQFVSYDEYRTSVLAYAKQTLRFLINSTERIFKEDFEKKGYEAFLTEYTNLLEEHTV